jgi:hypothetical protein
MAVVEISIGSFEKIRKPGIGPMEALKTHVAGIKMNTSQYHIPRRRIGQAEKADLRNA